jgi:hypothetical protein
MGKMLLVDQILLLAANFKAADLSSRRRRSPPLHGAPR